MKREFVFLTLFLGIGFGSLEAKANECDVYSFGDSLSDVGKKSKESSYNLSDKVEPPSKPYFNGRFADGLVWVEYVKAFACPDGNLTSYATGGAFTDDRNLNIDIAPDATGLSVAVQRAIGDGVAFDTGDVVLLWAGANDYIFDTIAAVTDPTGTTPLPNPFEVVGNIVDAIEQLAGQGATTFVVPNMPALGDIPFAGAVDPSGDLSVGLNQLSDGHNQILAFAIADLNALGLTVIPVDVHSTFDAILENPGDFGFRNVAVPCLIQDDARNRTPSGVCPEKGNTHDAAGTAFWDLVHPTTAVHQLIAASANGALGAVDASAQVATAR